MNKKINCSFKSNQGDLNAKHYKENSQLQLSLAQEIFLNYQFKGNESILDIGCGDGKITAEIAERIPYGRIMGIDKSTAMIASAKDFFPKTLYKNLNFKLKIFNILKQRKSIILSLHLVAHIGLRIN